MTPDETVDQLVKICKSVGITPDPKEIALCRKIAHRMMPSNVSPTRIQSMLESVGRIAK